MTHPLDFVEDPDDRRVDEDYYADKLAHDFYLRHQNRLDEQERREEKAGRRWGHIASRDLKDAA